MAASITTTPPSPLGGREILLYLVMYWKYVQKWCLLKRNRIIWPGVAANGQFSFIHSGHFYSAPFKSSTTQRRSRLQHGYCIGASCRSAQTTVGKGLAQGPYVAARTGVESTTIRLKVIDSTKALPRPTILSGNIGAND